MRLFFGSIPDGETDELDEKPVSASGWFTCGKCLAKYRTLDELTKHYAGNHYVKEIQTVVSQKGRRNKGVLT